MTDTPERDLYRVNRRAFLATSGAAAAMCSGCSVFTSQAKTDARLKAVDGVVTLGADATTALQRAGSVFRLQVPDGPRLLIVRVGGTELKALDAACTHWGSDVEYDPADPENALECPTHGSRFALLTGKVLEGPASEPLKVYRVEEDGPGGTIRIRLSG